MVKTMDFILWKVSLVLLLVGIGAGAAFWLSQSSVLAVDEIVVEGNHVVSTEEIMEKAGPLLRGQSLRPAAAFDAVSSELSAEPFIEERGFRARFSRHGHHPRPRIPSLGQPAGSRRQEFYPVV